MKKVISFLLALILVMSMCTSAFAATSASQITNSGGSTTVDEVTISKTIAGTDIENVFDITLTAKTTTNIQTLSQDPDMAVVIVMDISFSMRTEMSGVTKRKNSVDNQSYANQYEAALVAAGKFVDLYRTAASSSQTSKIGFVAFNSDSYQAAAMQNVKTAAQATSFKNTYTTYMDNVFYASGYTNANHKRFTNIEAGIRRAYNMIKDLPNQNKFIVFLSDGFPTTYCTTATNYTGYDPYTPNATAYNTNRNGQFYDAKQNHPCSYGTSYSDCAAIFARKQAVTVKQAGVDIFSIGINVGGQTIKGFDTHSGDNFSVIDRPNVSSNTAYEIGGYDDASYFKDWLKGSSSAGIGSGYYYDSTNQTEINNAFTSIFNEMKTKTEERAAKAWQVTDPMGTNLEFIGFYDKNGVLQSTSTNLSGSFGSAKENTATYTSSSKTFNWNLQKSGYSLSSGTYTYTLKYRVRLTNEAAGFTEGTSYNTNGKTTLTYQTITTVNGNSTISDIRTMNYEIPKVKGYLSELTFTKVDQYGRPVQEAVFKLEHDSTNCNKCKGSNPNTYVAKSGNLNDKTATSDANGTVTFMNIPSGHKYKLTETSAPAGYEKDSGTYHVTVAYDVLTTGLKNNMITDPQDNYQIQIKKVDGTTQQEILLSGAKFSVYTDASLSTPATHPDGTEIGEVTTGTDGKASLGIVDINKTYYLKETEAPAGYDLLTEAVVITVSPGKEKEVTALMGTSTLTVTQQEDTLIYIITVPNNHGVELPATGGPGTLLYTLGGIAILMASALMYVFSMRHGERRLM